jgi:hypothetical protein
MKIEKVFIASDATWEKISDSRSPCDKTAFACVHRLTAFAF